MRIVFVLAGITLAGVVLAGSNASATPSSDLEKLFPKFTRDEGETKLDAPRFAMTNGQIDTDLAHAYRSLGGMNSQVDSALFGVTPDGKAAWVASEIRFVGDCGGPGCGRLLEKEHFAGVFERGKTGWQPAAWNMSMVVTGDQQAAATQPLDPIPAQIEAGAEAAAKQFQATLADPKALAKTLSDRKDAVLFGSEDKERVVGGAAIKAKLAAWNLGFKVHDGVRAGVSGALVWIAANVDATPAGKPKLKPTPYRALFVYERVGDAWELVLLQFSFAR